MHQTFFTWNGTTSGDIVTAPGLWSLDNFGNTLIATISGGETFEWDSDPTTAQKLEQLYLLMLQQHLL